MKQIALFGMLGGLTFGAKFVMSFLPNIEPVSLMIMLFMVTYGIRGLFPVGVYVMLEILVYGIGLWNINYIYVWPILAFVALALRKMQDPLAWALLSGIFGLLFGALCAPVDVVIGGFSYALAKWVSGIPFDLLHCVGNFCIALFLFAPMRKLLKKLSGIQ